MGLGRKPNEKLATTPGVGTCLVIVALFAVLIHDQMGAKRSEGSTKKNTSEPSREPPRNPVRARFTMPA